MSLSLTSSLISTISLIFCLTASSVATAAQSRLSLLNLCSISHTMHTHTHTEKAAGEDGGGGWRGGLSIAPEGLISATLFVYYCTRSNRWWQGNNKQDTVASGFLLMPPADACIRTAGGAACDATLMYSERRTHGVARGGEESQGGFKCAQQNLSNKAH